MASKQPTDALTDPWGDYRGSSCEKSEVFSVWWRVVRSGYSAEENPMINVLSRRMLRLATIVVVVQAVVSLTIFVYLVFMSRTSTHIVSEILDVTLTILVNVLVMRAGVFAIESRNAVCCCGWRSMQIFYTWYVVICVFHALWIALVFLSLAFHSPDNTPEWTELVVEGLFLNFLTLTLNACIADYARRLLEILPNDEEPVHVSRVPSFEHGSTTVVEDSI